eukprot:TRINITY_DN32182_c0_g1_i1.p1 TRINITY_DN32182_c0_g1~~TRINITY_DN32182_c0_g1_i1.p1  ORF type:complete len:1896 (+),score=393.74 TRINITY_DN32182_c0_g1_i1:177-5690(+)
MFMNDFERGLRLANAAAEEESEDEDGDDGEDSDEETRRRLQADGSLQEWHLDTCVHLLDKLRDPGTRMSAKDLDEMLLHVRPASQWAIVVQGAWDRERPAQDRKVDCQASTNGALRLLCGRVTLYEVLRALGPSWAAPARALREMAQQRLVSLSSGVHSYLKQTEPALPLEALLRGGASLLCPDSRGRLPAHRAASSNSTSLSMLARLLELAPVTLIAEDDEGTTPLELLARSPLLKNTGYAEEATGTGIVVALADGGIHDPRSEQKELLSSLADVALACVAALPRRTASHLQQSPEAASAWRSLLSGAGGSCAAMLLDADTDTSFVERQLEHSQLKAEEHEGHTAAMLRQGLLRVGVLQRLAADREQLLQAHEPQELRLRLAFAEQAAEQQKEEAAKAQASLEQEIRQLRRSLAEKEDELLLAASKPQRSSRPEQSEGPQGAAKKVGSDASSPPPPDTHAASLEAPTHTGDAVSAERSVVESIRKARLVGVDLESLPEALRQGVVEMRQSLTAAVDRLARDLYESQAHFVQELLQNADDNSYAEGVVPSMELVLRCRHGIPNPYFFAANNERGLNEADVRALCDISRSSKSQATGATTGYKGVGWKSVFRVCEDPHVLSQGWQFKFSSQGLGMLTPEWIEESTYLDLPEEVRSAHGAGKTVFYLPLAEPESSMASIRAEMQAIQDDSAQLLFLRRLRALSLSGYVAAEGGAHQGELEVRMTAITGRDNGKPAATLCQRLHRDKDNPQKSNVLEETETQFEVFSHEDVSVALPLLSELQPQRVFAFLPVRSVGFRFAIQAPFHLTASRADLHRSPENLRRRNAVAPAFIGACRACPDTAARALEYLGMEPAEAFWVPVREQIVEGLKDLACVATEGGSPAEPAKCLLRGRLPAARWVTNDLLAQACDGLQFASGEMSGALRELGVREFGFKELTACLCHNNGCLLQALWKDHERRGATFSDIFSSLADALLENPARLEEMQELRVFPVAAETSSASDNLSATLKNEVNLSCSDGLHNALCKGIPPSWQVPLVRCLHPDLSLSSHSLQLLELLGIKNLTEGELEAAALRTVLSMSAFQENEEESPRCSIGRRPFELNAYWASLAVLRRCFLLNHSAPAPGWEELRGSILLRTNSGNMAPASQLRPWSFLGIQAFLPLEALCSICTFADITGVSLQLCDSKDAVQAPPQWFEEVAQASDENLDWEVFLCCALGCSPADPLGRPMAGTLPVPEGHLEVLLKLGNKLASGDFWQRALETKQRMSYLEEALLGHPSAGHGSAVQRRNFLRHLSVRFSDRLLPLALEDLFLREAFQSMGGQHLPYLSDIPPDERVWRLLSSCGVSTEVDIKSLLKALRYLKENDVQDIGLAADIYGRLHKLGFPGPGSKRMLLVPGQGYMHSADCCWKPFRQDLLRRCCRLEALSLLYQRFGPDVLDPLQSWVRPSPEADAWEICDTLLQAILCARAEPSQPHKLRGKGKALIQPEEAAENLFAASKAAVEALVKVCVGEVLTCESEDLEALVPAPRADAMGTVAFNHYVQHRMIVIPASNENDSYCRVLAMGEAFWSVEEGLEDNPAARSALKIHYGSGPNSEAVRIFFTEVLRVRPVLTVDDLMRLASLPSVPFPGQDAASQSNVGEGLDLSGALPRMEPPPLTRHFDVDAALQEALRRAQALSSEDGPESESPPWNPLPPRVWQQIGFVGRGRSRIPLFSANGAQPSPVTLPDHHAQLLFRLCSYFRIDPAQLAFAYDPSGRCVCRERLFLDMLQIPRGVLAENQADYWALLFFWSGKFARMIACQGTGDPHGIKLLKNHLLQLALPGIMRAESGSEDTYGRQSHSSAGW